MSIKPRPSNCSGCPFGTRTIASRGPKDSRFVIVGESPGSAELVANAPFVGPSGKMLDETLASLGFNELGIEPYITNALSCYPSGKDVDSLARATKCCQERLFQELLEHPRDVILCLGSAASMSVTNDFGLKITKERGRVIPSNLATKGVVLAVHPAYLMRNGGGYPFWKKDLGQAVKLLRGEPLGGWEEPTWSVITKPSELAALIPEYHAAPYITGDYETDQLHWYDGRFLCLGITKGDGSHVDIIPEDLIYKAPNLMKRLLSGGKWAWHNSLFDVTWSRAPQHQYMGAKADHDTMLMSYSLNENRGFHDLDQVAQHWIGAPRHKGMLDQYLPNKQASYRLVPSAVLYHYCAIDLSKQHKMLPPLLEAVKADEHSNKLYHNLLMPAVEELVRMKLQGVLVDRAKVEANEALLDAQIKEVADRINNEYAIPKVGMAINVGSSQQLAGLLYDKLELKIPGTRSTDEDTLILVQRRYDHPIINLILRHRELVKQKGTYVSNLLRKKHGTKFIPGHIKPDGCVYPDFKLHGTSTGRLAGSDPNLLNQPRAKSIRGQYVARPGRLFVEVDENQAELRSLTIMSGDKLLTEIYTENKISIHDVTTGAFYAPKEDVLKGELAYERVRQMLHLQVGMEPGTVYREAKMRGKAVNFGIVYGREAHSLAVEFNISVREAQRWIDTWFETYPGAAAFIKWCRRKPAEGRNLITVYGRKKRHGVVAREKLKALQNEAANFPHQSTASDIMLETVIECAPVLRQRWDAHCWNEVYDAVYYEIAIQEAAIAESIKFVQEAITAIPIRHGLTRIPFLGDAKVGLTWGSMEDWEGSLEATLGKSAEELLALQQNALLIS